MQYLDAQTSTRLARERHAELARAYATRTTAVPAQPQPERRSRRQRLVAALRPRAA